MSRPSVTAYILTYDDPDALRSCLDGVLSQEPAPEEVVVVDNDSRPPVSLDGTPVAGEVRVRILRLDENVGPAGGHAAGLRDFLETDTDVAWIFDDDVIPEPGCLRASIDSLHAHSGTVFPNQVGPDGRADDVPRWAGVLIPRLAVETAGIPRADLFWWIEDTEYLAHRLPRAGFPMARAAGARVRHTASRRTTREPDWKIYYETRNTVYYRIRIQRGRRAWKIVRYLARRVGRIVQQPPPRGTRFKMLGVGLLDGLRGRLGKTVDPPRAG